MNNYTIAYAKTLLAATPQSQLVEAKRIKGLTDEQIALMERESINLERTFKIAEKDYGTDHLDAVVINGYIAKLLGNARLVRYLLHHHKEILAEFQKIAEADPVAA